MERFVRSTLESASREELERLLAQHPLIEGMDQSHLDMLAKLVQPAHFESGKYIFQEGQPAERLYLILHGAVTLEVFSLDPGAIQLQTLCDGEVLGWSWIVAPYRWRFDAKAVHPTDALMFDTKQLMDLCEQHTDLGFDFMRRMAGIVEQRLTATKDQLLKSSTFHR